MRRNVCKHVSHKETEHKYKPSPTGKAIYVTLVSGYNPIRRRLEICDEGFFSPKKKYIEE